MVDLSAAFSEVKSLPDEALNQELSNPSGALPGYLIMSELQDRQAVRAGSGGGKSTKRPSMKDELLQSLPRPEPLVPRKSWTFGASGAGQMPTVVENPEPRMGPPQQQPPMEIDPSRQYSRGGIIGALNLFNTQAQMMQNPDLKGGMMQDAMMQANGGRLPLQAAQTPGPLQSPMSTGSMVPTAPERPTHLRSFNNGGLASLYGR